MAQDVKTFLTKIGLVTSGFKAELQDIDNQLSSIRNREDQASEKRKQTLRDESTAIKSALMDLSLTGDQVHKIVIQEQERVDLNRQVKEQLDSAIRQLENQTDEIKKQLDLTKEKAKEEKEHAGELGKLFNTFGQAASGGGLLGSFVAGAAGGGAVLVLEKVAEAAGEVIKTFTEIPFKAGEVAEKFENMAARTGTTIEELQKLRLAGSSVGMSLESMSTLLIRMSMMLTKNTADGVSKAEKELGRFGIKIRDVHTGSLIPLTDLLLKLSDLFEKMPDRMTKNRIMIDLFGRSGTQLIPVLNQGRDALKELFDQANEYSVTISKDLIEAQHKWNVETEKLKIQWDQFTVTMGEGVLPMLVKCLDYINRIAAGINQVVGVNTPRQFADEIANWATRQAALSAGPGGKYERKELSEHGMSIFKNQKVGEELPKQLKTKSGMDVEGIVGSEMTYAEAFTALRNAPNPEIAALTSQLTEIFGKKFPEELKKAEEASQKLDPRLQDNEKAVRKLNATTDKYLETLAKLKEKQDEQALEAQKSDVKSDYDKGAISEEEYVNRTKAVDQALYESKTAYINAWSEDEKKKIQDTVKNHAQAAEQIKIIETETQIKLTEARTKYNQQNQALDLQYQNALQSARQITYQEELKHQQETIALKKKLLDQDNKQGIISVDSYLKDRAILIAQEVQIQQDAYQKEYEEGKKTPQALAKLWKDMQEAVTRGEKELTEILHNENEIRFKNIQEKNDNIKKILQEQLKISTPGSKTQGQILSNLMQVSADDETVLTSMLGKVQQYSLEWFKIKEAIVQSRLEQNNYNAQLKEMNQLSVNIATGFERIAQELSKFGGPGFQAFVSGMKEGAATLKLFTEFSAKNKGETIFGTLFGAKKPKEASAEDELVAAHKRLTQEAINTQGAFKDTVSSALTPFKQKVIDAANALQQIVNVAQGKSATEGTIGGGGSPVGGTGSLSGLAGLFASFGQSSDVALGDTEEGSFNSGLSKAVEGLNNFTKHIGDAVGAVGSFIGTITNAQSGAGGALGGLQAGAGLGGDIGGGIGKLMGTAGAAAGPIGMAVGAVAGTILGFMSGEKNAKAQQQLKKLTDSFNASVKSFQDGTTSLNDTIKQLSSIEAQTASKMGGAKKKQKASYQQAIDSMNQQIQQLQLQQQKLIDEMNKQIDILRAPEGMQEYLTQLDAIIAKYQQYASAAKDAAQANEYLNLALQQFVSQGQQQLTSAEVTAIQNAIQLNDLLQQRQALIRDEAQKEYDIMTQGVLVRQRTLAQNKAGQIAQLRINTADQLDQINQQISLAQYKYLVESKIFNMATTKIALEAQLLQLQEGQFSRDMERITALQQIISMIQSGANLNSFSALWQSLYGTPPPNAVPTPGYITGAAGYDPNNGYVYGGLIPGAAPPSYPGMSNNNNGSEWMFMRSYNQFGRYGSGRFRRESV